VSGFRSAGVNHRHSVHKYLLSVLLLVGLVWVLPARANAQDLPCTFDGEDENCGLLAHGGGSCPSTTNALFVVDASCMVWTRTLNVEAWSCSNGTCTTPDYVRVEGSTSSNGPWSTIGYLTQDTTGMCNSNNDLWYGSFCFGANDSKPDYIRFVAISPGIDSCGIEDYYAQWCCDCSEFGAWIDNASSDHSRLSRGARSTLAQAGPKTARNQAAGCPGRSMREVLTPDSATDRTAAGRLPALSPGLGAESPAAAARRGHRPARLVQAQ